MTEAKDAIATAGRFIECVAMALA